MKNYALWALLILICSCSSVQKNEHPVMNAKPDLEVDQHTSLEDLLRIVSIRAIALGDFKYADDAISNEWLGAPPPSQEDINETEKRLGIKLPQGYLDFMAVTNGFEATASTFPAFHTIDKIDYLIHVDPFQIDLWLQDGTEDIGLKMKRSIIVGGINDEQYFLLIPPLKDEEWEYWEFASWYPGEVVYRNFKTFWFSVEAFLKENEGL